MGLHHPARPAVPGADFRRQGDEHLVRFGPGSSYDAPNLKAVLADPARVKLYHFARFDLAAIEHYLGVMAAPVFCTKIASKLTRTYTDRHGLKNLVERTAGRSISKQQQSSDWGGPELSRRSAIMPPATCAISTACTTI
jgi:ribonuclease D